MHAVAWQICAVQGGPSLAGTACKLYMCKLQLLAHSLPLPSRATPPAAADDSGIGLRARTLDWGGAMNLLQVDSGATLAFQDLISSQPGNFTAGEEVRLDKRLAGGGAAV